MRVIAKPIAGSDPRPGVPIATVPPDATRLSTREWEILRLVATGRSDRQIAEELCVSRHTVGNHVRHILAKLDVATRAAAVAAASRVGAL